MSIWVLLALVIGLTVAIYFVLRPLKLLHSREFWLSHGFVWAGLWLVWGYVVFQNPDKPIDEMSMLMGGMWTLGGGICLAVLYALRRLAEKRRD